MKAVLGHLKERSLWRDRYVLLGLSVFLMVLNLVQGIALLGRSERVILVPPEIRRPLEIQGEKVSVAYLEEMSRFLVHLVWDRSKESGIGQTNLVLRYVSPESYGALRSRLIGEYERIEREDIRTSFAVTGMTVEGLVVRADGVVRTYAGREFVGESRKRCRLEYGFEGGMLRLKALEEETI